MQYFDHVLCLIIFMMTDIKPLNYILLSMNINRFHRLN